MYKRRFLRTLFADETPDDSEDNSMIEISGPSDSGKTLLTQKLLGQELSELDWIDAIYVCLSQKGRASQLADMIKSNESISNEEDLEKRLESVHLLNCFTPEEFDESLELIKYMLRANRNIKLLVFDTLTEFFWLQTEQSTIKMSKWKYYNKYIDSLDAICKDSNVSAMWTVNSTFLKEKGASSSKIKYKLQLTVLPGGGILLNGQPVELNGEGVHFIDTEDSKEPFVKYTNAMNVK